MAEFKILITSQKGGVGKSTVSANLAAYLCRQGRKVALLDFDLHGSSSKWLEGAPPIGIDIHHEPLPLEIGGTRPVHEAKLKLRRLCYSNDIVISDLTWSDSMTAELLFEYDLVIVPTSVSEIELAATAGFLSRHRWVFDSAIHTPPTLLVAPTRVQPEQLQSDVFSKQRFPVSFMLAPPILEAQSARDMFERGYLMDLQDACGRSFNEFGQSVGTARKMRSAQQSLQQTQRTTTPSTSQALHSKLGSHSHVLNQRNNLLSASSSLSSQYSILGRHRMHKVRPEEPVHKAVAPTSSGMGAMSIPQFLKRMSMGVISK